MTTKKAPAKATAKKEVTKKVKRPLNAWQIHVEAFRKANPTMKVTEVMKAAKLTYKK